MATMDAILASKLNSSLKFCATSFAHSALEASTPEVRNAFVQACQNAISRQEELSKLMEQRGWYRAPDAHPQDIQQILPQLQALSQASPVGVH